MGYAIETAKRHAANMIRATAGAPRYLARRAAEYREAAQWCRDRQQGMPAYFDTLAGELEAYLAA